MPRNGDFMMNIQKRNVHIDCLDKDFHEDEKLLKRQFYQYIYE